MPDKTPAEKARVKPGTRFAVLDAMPGVVEALGLPEPQFVELPQAQIVLLPVLDRAALDARLPQVVAALAPGAAVWVLFRKGSKSAGLDINRDSVWSVAEGLGLRPLGLIGVDETWSAFRLRPGA